MSVAFSSLAYFNLWQSMNSDEAVFIEYGVVTDSVASASRRAIDPLALCFRLLGL